MYKLKEDLAIFSLNYVKIDKYQDLLFQENQNAFWGGNSNYSLLKSQVSSSIDLIDSILINKSSIKNKLSDNLKTLKALLSSYNSTILKISQLNAEIYEPTTGLIAKNDFLIKNTYSDNHFKNSGLTDYFDELIDYGKKLNRNEIGKKEYQKSCDKILEDVSNLKVGETEKYFYLLFQDRFADYYNNILLQYVKLRQIGFNYNEGLMKSVDIRNHEINSLIDKLNIDVDNKYYKNYKSYLFDYILLVFVINLFIFIVFYSIYRIIYVPWKELEPQFDNFSKGNIQKFTKNSRVTELNLISTAFNNHVENLFERIGIIEDLSKRNYSKDFKPKEFDKLGNSIVKLMNDLKKSEKEAQQYRETEENQKWAANGIAKIGAVMRQYTNDIDMLSKNILKEILEYVDAVQGALYLYDKNANVLRLNTYYSYGKLRLKNNEIKPYEGMVGTVLIEKKEYYFSDIPADYIFLETGLGYTKPKSLFIFPLLFENQIYGIIELASLEQMPKYVRDFILSLSNEVAITISYTQINVQTNVLLVQSEKQAKELQSNEKLYKKNQDNLKSLLRMTEQKLNEKESELFSKEELLRQKVNDLISIEKEISDKDENIENMTNEYENIKSTLENQNEDLRKRIEELEKRLREK